jgi:hypothetical protein
MDVQTIMTAVISSAVVSALISGAVSLWGKIIDNKFKSNYYLFTELHRVLIEIANYNSPGFDANAFEENSYNHTFKYIADKSTSFVYIRSRYITIKPLLSKKAQSALAILYEQEKNETNCLAKEAMTKDNISQRTKSIQELRISVDKTREKFFLELIQAIHTQLSKTMKP